ncbi:hypothetical protein AMECASPLE_008711 [Ameca splendens]|uniref:Sema domain-containing protein n=1 Tax=Ameca splendens TaxID=208324 RepID=A0ABV0ZKL1_9TELE
MSELEARLRAVEKPADSRGPLAGVEPPRVASRSSPSAEPAQPQVGWVTRSSSLSSPQMTEDFVSKGVSSHPTEEAHFSSFNSIAASAVCAFNLSAITQAFNGPFRSQENPRSTWLPTANPIHNFQCGTINDKGPNEGLTERSLQDAQRLYLMNDVVQPESVDPLVMQDDVRFSNLVVDIVQGMDTLYHVMYISTG